MGYKCVSFKSDFLFDDGKSCQVIPEGHYWTDDTLGGWHKAYPENDWEAMGGYG